VTEGNIDAMTLRDMLERGERVTVVDVRKGEDYTEWSIPGSVHVDAYDALNSGDERAMEGLELPEGTPVVTVCGRGRSSTVAAEQLRRQGYEALSLGSTGNLSARRCRKCRRASGSCGRTRTRSWRRSRASSRPPLRTSIA
jgi:rhodanese-related sulfurtransferase